LSIYKIDIPATISIEIDSVIRFFVPVVFIISEPGIPVGIAIYIHRVIGTFTRIKISGVILCNGVLDNIVLNISPEACLL